MAWRPVLNNKTRIALSVAAWGLVVWVGLIDRVLRHKPFFADFGAILCAGQRSITGANIFGSGACFNISSTTYVYPPWVATTAALLIKAVGPYWIEAIYLPLFYVCMAGILTFTLFRNRNGDIRQRLPFIGLMSSGPFAFANIAIIVFGVVAASAFWLGADSLLLTALIVLVSLIKPVYITFLTIPLFSRAPAWKRAAYALAALAIVTTCIFSPAPDVVAWRKVIYSTVVPGALTAGADGAAHASVWASLHIAQIGYLLFAAASVLSAYLVVACGPASDSQRIWVAIMVASVVFPRLMAYDRFMVAPGYVIVCNLLSQHDAMLGRRVGQLGLAACVLAFVGTMGTGVLHILNVLSNYLLAAGIVIAGFYFLRRLGNPVGVVLLGREPLSIEQGETLRSASAA
jgi:hypothetical protein